ncbi:unnamed protein product [Ectocarpus sp. 6 AP-2014]
MFFLQYAVPSFLLCFPRKPCSVQATRFFGMQAAGFPLSTSCFVFLLCVRFCVALQPIPI